MIGHRQFFFRGGHFSLLLLKKNSIDVLSQGVVNIMINSFINYYCILGKTCSSLGCFNHGWIIDFCKAMSPFVVVLVVVVVVAIFSL